jgi:hypothetical protein
MKNAHFDRLQSGHFTFSPTFVIIEYKNILFEVQVLYNIGIVKKLEVRNFCGVVRLQ